MPTNKQPTFEENVKNSFLRVKEHVSILETHLKADRAFLTRQNEQIRFLLEEIRQISAERDELKAKLSVFNKESSIGNEGVYSNIHSLNIHSTDIHSTNKQITGKEEQPINVQNQPKKEDARPALEPVIAENQEIQEINDSPIPPVIQQPLVVNNRYDSSLDLAHSRRQTKQNSSSILQGHSSIIGLKSEINSKFLGLSRQEFLTFLTIYQLEEEVEHVSYIDVSAKLALTEGCIRTYVSSLMKKGLPLVKLKYNNKVVYLSIQKDFRALNLKRELMALYYKADPTQKTLAEGFS